MRFLRESGSFIALGFFGAFVYTGGMDGEANLLGCAIFGYLTGAIHSAGFQMGRDDKHREIYGHTEKEMEELIGQQRQEAVLEEARRRQNYHPPNT